MRLMEGEHVGPFNLGNPGEFTMLELAQVCLILLKNIHNFDGFILSLCGIVASLVIHFIVCCPQLLRFQKISGREYTETDTV